MIKPASASKASMRPWLLVGLLVLPACAPPPPKQLTAIITTREAAIPEHPAPASEVQPHRYSSPLAESRLSPRDLPQALRFLESLVELEKLRQMYPERHEVIFNEAILMDGYGSILDAAHHDVALRTTIKLYRLFIEKAANDPDAQGPVRIAKNRLGELESVLYCVFTKETEADRKQRAQEEKQRAAEEEILRDEPEQSASKK